MDWIIRKWRNQDAKNLANALNNKKIQANLRDGLPYPYTEQDAADFIQSMLEADPNKTFAFAIVNEKDEAIGSIGAFRCENIHHLTAEMGYYIAEEYWGQGIGTKAIKQLTDHLFSDTDIIRIFAEPFSTNHASCHLLEKNGFQLEGTLRKNAIKNGVILDMQMYSLIK